MAANLKIGKCGAITLPSEVLQQLGLEAGSELTVEVRGGEIRLRPAARDDAPVLTAHETAYYILMNCRTKEDWDENLPRVLELGIDLAQVPGVELNRRDGLPSRADWEEGEEKRRAARLEELHRA